MLVSAAIQEIRRRQLPRIYLEADMPSALGFWRAMGFTEDAGVLYSRTSARMGGTEKDHAACWRQFPIPDPRREHRSQISSGLWQGRIGSPIRTGSPILARRTSVGLRSREVRHGSAVQ